MAAQETTNDDQIREFLRRLANGNGLGFLKSLISTAEHFTSTSPFSNHNWWNGVANFKGAKCDGESVFTRLPKARWIPTGFRRQVKDLVSRLESNLHDQGVVSATARALAECYEELHDAMHMHDIPPEDQLHADVHDLILTLYLPVHMEAYVRQLAECDSAGVDRRDLVRIGKEVLDQPMRTGIVVHVVIIG